MKIYSLLFFVLMASMAFGQVKIGYTNIELVLAYMPESKTMDRTIQTYQQKLSDNIKTRESILQARYQAYIDHKQSNPNDSETLQGMEAELQKLDQELKKMASDSEFKIYEKKEELLKPILEKLQSAINEVAEDKKMTYILNQTTSSGVSTILYGPEEEDITEALMKKLGIEVPRN